MKLTKENLPSGFLKFLFLNMDFYSSLYNHENENAEYGISRNEYYHTVVENESRYESAFLQELIDVFNKRDNDGQKSLLNAYLKGLELEQSILTMAKTQTFLCIEEIKT